MIYMMKSRFSLVLGILLVLMIGTVSAFTILSPTEVLVQTPIAIFETTIVNDSAQEKALSIAFFAPMRTEVMAPPTIKANSQAKAQITVYNFTDLQNTTYQTRLNVMLGNENASRNLAVSFKELVQAAPPVPTPPSSPSEPAPPTLDSNQSDSNQMINSVLIGMATFFNNPATEFALQALLVVIIIVFAIAFIARLYNRAKESSK